MRSKPCTGLGWLKGLAILAVITAGVLGGLPETKAQDLKLDGYFSTQYRLRATGDVSDHDLYQYAALDVGDPMRDRLSFHLFARGAYDLDGNRETEGFYAFDSIEDTYDEPLTGHLYHAYLDVHRLTGVSMLRVGRQTMYDSPVFVYFDGGRVETAPAKALGNLQVGAYGGTPVNLYESYENNTGKDTIYGAYVQARPWNGGRMRLDWTHVKDEYLYGEETDDFYALGVWQAITPYLQVHGKFTRFEDENHDALGRVTFYSPQWDLMVQGSYYELLEEESNRTVMFDPMYISNREYHPYWQGQLIVYKGLGDNFAAQGGFDQRQLKDDADVSNYNHEFSRYWGSLTMIDVPVDGLEVTGTGEVWDSEDQLEKIESYGADVTYRPARELATSIGAYYDLYKYDYYLDEEKNEVQTYYAKFKYAPKEGFGVGLLYEYEDDDFDDYQTVKVELKYQF